MTQPAGLVSVVIPAYRAAGSLDRAVRSALDGQDVPVEVLIVDDRSPDDTFGAARALAERDSRVIALQNPVNGGPGAARNTAIDDARGDWIAVLDADDAFAPGRLARMIEIAREQEADLVLGNMQEVDETGAILRRRFLTEPAEARQWSAEDFVQGNLASAGSRTSGYLKPLFRKAFLDAHGIRYDPALRNGEDFHIVMACLFAGARLWFSPAPDYLYTRGGASISHRADLGHLEALAAADARIAERRDLSDRLRALLRQRVGETRDLLAAESAMRDLKARRLLAAGGTLARRPRAVGRFARQLGEALRKRL